MEPTASILATLRAETRVQHEAIERHVALLGDRVTHAQYVHYLERAYGFHAPLEARLARVPGLAVALPDVSGRWRTHALAHDLRALDRDPNSLPTCDTLPDVRDVSDAFGCLYVLEGSTLGGQVLARHLRTVLGAELPLAFMTAHGAGTGAWWKSFGACLAAHAAGRSHEPYVAAARATFATFDAWLAGA